MNNKIVYSLFFLLLAPLVFHAQHSLTGVWSGTVSNDSTTVRHDQSFEIALTQYREKVYGYSRTTFIVNDTLYYILKRVKGKIDADLCEVKDDEIISYNFPGRIDKGIRVTTTFRMNKQDTTWHLDGNWSTNKTKRFYAISGKVQLKEETDPGKSKIFAHLEELKLDKELPGILPAPASAVPPTVNAVPATASAVPATVTAVPAPASAMPAKVPGVKGAVPVVPDTAIALPANKLPFRSPGAGPTAQPVTPADKDSARRDKPASTKNLPASKPSMDPTPAVAVPANLPAAAELMSRKNVMSQEVLFTGDSLEIAIYDNGEIDGDTVSILLNDELILSKQVLKATAVRKNIATPAGQTAFTLTLYAENLGKYPPNTGLLVVKDATTTHQIRFSADLQQNAAIIFRRKE